MQRQRISINRATCVKCERTLTTDNFPEYPRKYCGDCLRPIYKAQRNWKRKSLESIRDWLTNKLNELPY